VKKCVTLEAEEDRQRSRPRKTWKELVDKDMDDLYIKLKMIRENWSD